MDLSILDICQRSDMKPPRQALQETLELACLADGLGYKRYWLAEHHTDDAAHASPEVLIPLVASRTNRIHVGSGGVLLRYYSPLKVAETFLTIEALFPGRIDLGVCKGIGVSAAVTARALVSGNTWELTDEAFQTKVRELIGLYRCAPALTPQPDTVPKARPWGVKPPPIWVLGSGTNSMKLAASAGRPYSFMTFYDFDSSWGPLLMKQYRESFLCDGESAPQASIVVIITCMETDALAWQRESELVGSKSSAGHIVGSPQRCAQELFKYADLYGVSELILMTGEPGYQERRDMYGWIAEECGILCGRSA